MLERPFVFEVVHQNRFHDLEKLAGAGFAARSPARRCMTERLALTAAIPTACRKPLFGSQTYLRRQCLRKSALASFRLWK
jgi:hypothetical protein